LFARTLTSLIPQALTGVVRSERRIPVVRLMQTLLIVGGALWADAVCVNPNVEISTKTIVRKSVLLTFVS
jgi:hypothetical protein